MDTGRHVMLQEKESVYDTVRRQWAAITTSVKGQNQKAASTEYQYDPTISEALSKTPLGWGLKKPKANVRISAAVKKFLTRKAPGALPRRSPPPLGV